MQLLYYPHPMLRHTAFKVEQITPVMREHAAEMFSLMYAHGGCGLAATQVGLNYAMVVVNPTGMPNPKTEFVAINPYIRRHRGQRREEEGCLSIPDCRVTVPRSTWIELVSTTLDGDIRITTCEGHLARIFQHELDHLAGKLIIDRRSTVSVKSRRMEVLLNRYVREFTEKNPTLSPVP